MTTKKQQSYQQYKKVLPQKLRNTAPQHLLAEGVAVGARIYSARTALGWTQGEAAKELGSSPRAWSEYESGRAFPKAQVLAGLAAMGINADWLLTGEGSMRRGEAQPDQATALEKEGAIDPGREYALIPVFDVRASAGVGSLVSGEEIVGQIPFRLDWIKGELRASVEGLRAVSVEGDSMSPTINPGDQILVDTTGGGRGDGIHLIRIGDTLLVKRLQRMPDGEIRVSSDNPIYQPYSVKSEEQDVAILGRVVWHGKWI